MKTIFQYTEENINLVKRLRNVTNAFKEFPFMQYVAEAEREWVLPMLTPVFYRKLVDYVELQRIEDKTITLSDNNDRIITTNAGEVITISLQDYYDYDTLMNGGYYNNGKCRVEGLLEAIAYLSMSRFLLNQRQNITQGGIVEKQQEYSNNITASDNKRISNDMREIGLKYLKNCVDYCIFQGYIKKPCCNAERKPYSAFKLISR